MCCFLPVASAVNFPFCVCLSVCLPVTFVHCAQAAEDIAIFVHTTAHTASDLKDLFHNIHPKRIISFIHAIGLTNKL